MSYSGRMVIRGGQEIRHILDGHQQAQGYDWALLDIFAPYRAEYVNGAEVGSLWESWLIAMERALAELKECYGASKVAEQKASK